MSISSHLALRVGAAVGVLASAAVPQGGQIALRQALRDATNDRLAVIVATHPDDQWVLPAAYLRFNKGFRVSVVLMTRGEGGQNIAGAEIGDALGRLRTGETARCAAYLDCDVHYLDRADAGYCRTAAEALDLWNRDTTIADFAGLLRTLRPDIVLTTHDPSEQHGHDLALLEIIAPAVKLAATHSDGRRAARIQRLFRGAGAESEDLRLPTETIDPDRGSTYRAIAYRALRFHRSQAPQPPMDEALTAEVRLVSMPIAGRPGETNLSEGVPTLFDELRGVADDSFVRHLIFDIEVRLWAQLGNSIGLVDLALDLRERLLSIPAPLASDLALRLRRRIDALERIVRHAAALEVTVTTPPDSVAVAGEPLPLTVTAHHIPDLIECVAIESRDAAIADVVTRSASIAAARFEGTVLLPEDFDAAANATNGAGSHPRSLTIALRLRVRTGERSGSELSIPIDLPIEVRPAIELTTFPAALLVPENSSSASFAVRVRRNTRHPLVDSLVVRSSFGVQPTPLSHRVEMRDETLGQYNFQLALPPNASSVRARIRLGAWEAELPIRRVAASLDPRLRIGLVPGVDAAVGEVLRSLGPQLVELTDDVLPRRDLADLDTIVIGIRALRSEAARAGFSRLLEYARSGGRLVVLYHKDSEFNLPSSGFRGYPTEFPLHIGKGRVTHEDQPVSVLLPEHPLLTTPNRISAGDWDGWVQERGLYFPDAYSEGYAELLEMADPGQPAERGALLYARVGDGEFIYCALALHRQIANLHGGACRLFANLVSREAR